MDQTVYDLVVVGGGSGGVRAARVAASLGARVALIEEHRVGGTCVIRGCVPKKLMVLAGRFAAEFADASGFGWEVGPVSFRWQRLVEAIGREVMRLEELYRKGLADSGVAVFDDHAMLDGAGSVLLQRAGTKLRCRNVLLATGSAPAPLDVPGSEHCITSDDIFSLGRQPARIAVLGGGYIGAELASALRSLGSEVILLHRAPALLRGFDESLQDGLTAAFVESGIRMHADTVAVRVEKAADGLIVHDSKGRLHHVDCVLNATGRRPRSTGLGLDISGVEVVRSGAIMVDSRHRTTAPNIYAVGDVTSKLNLTPVAIRQGQEVAHALFGGRKLDPVRYEIAPTAVFSTPELGTVGLAEGDARKQYADLKVFKTQFRPMRAALAGSAERISMKVLVGGDTDKILGVHLLGREAAEQIQLVAVALQLGATLRDLHQTLAVHPTAAEELVTLKAAS